MKEQKIKKAVALSYSEGMSAPTIVASGKGRVAENIIEEGKKSDIPVYKDEKIAAILTEMEVGNQIPEELYELVAKIMVFVGDMDKLYAKTKKSHQ